MYSLEIVINIIVAVPLLIIAVFLLFGKGSFLIAGFNTKSANEKAKYDEKALCRFTGLLLIMVVACLVLIQFGIGLELNWLIVAGAVLILAVLAGGVVYVNTNKRFLKDKD
jgi:preprotein translocase subunit SecG